MKLRSALIYIGYVIAFFISLYLFILLSLPSDQIASYVVENYVRPAGLNLTYKGTSISPFMDLVLKNVEVEITEENQRFNFERLSAGLSLWGYLSGTTPVIIKASGYGGEIGLSFGMKKDRINLMIKLSGVDLSMVDLIKEKSGLNIKGVVDLYADIRYDKKESKNNSGKIRLNIKGSEIKGGKVMGFEIPAINTGDLSSEIEIKEGKFKVLNFRSRGKDVEIRLSGDGGFSSPISRSNLNLSLRAKPAQAFIDKEEKLKTLLFGIGNSLDKEGFYNFSIKGTLSSPTFNIEKK